MNPFWNDATSKLDVESYLSKNRFSTPSAATIMLGDNDLSGMYTDNATGMSGSCKPHSHPAAPHCSITLQPCLTAAPNCTQLCHCLNCTMHRCCTARGLTALQHRYCLGCDGRQLETVGARIAGRRGEVRWACVATPPRYDVAPWLSFYRSSQKRILLLYMALSRAPHPPTTRCTILFNCAMPYCGCTILWISSLQGSQDGFGQDYGTSGSSSPPTSPPSAR